MSKLMELVRKLSSPDNKRVLDAVAELRAHGWLTDGSLVGTPLLHVHMQGADLMGANLAKVDLHQADLQWSDLSQANLSGAKLSRAKLQAADLSQADLTDADLFNANLAGARNVQESQLARASRLWGAIMPSGETYDGRYNLQGDLEFARWGRVDVDDPQAMADFLRIPLAVYLHGQELGRMVAV